MDETCQSVAWALAYYSGLKNYRYYFGGSLQNYTKSILGLGVWGAGGVQSLGRVSSRGLSLRTPGFRVPLRGLMGGSGVSGRGFRDWGSGSGQFRVRCRGLLRRSWDLVSRL